MTRLPPPPPDLLDGAALFLDFDGTLVDLAATPDAIRVPSGLGALLHDLRDRLEGRVAIISGRALADLSRHVPVADIAFCGSHGLEFQRADGSRLPLARPPGLDAVIAAVRGFAASRPGLLVEEKPAGIALHYRAVPGAAEAVDAFMVAEAEAAGLRIQRGAMVVELRPAGGDKGDAVRAFMAEPTFAGARPVFVGDDLTDEHAFAAAAALGGAGVLVGPERTTSARYRLGSVAAVTNWLERHTA